MLTFAPAQQSFIANSPEENAQTLADYSLADKLNAAKNIRNSNYRKTLEAFSKEFTRVEEKLEELVDEYYPEITNNLIVEWERALGIPDECFPGTGTQAERLRDLNVKFLSDTVVTNDDFVAVAAIYGVTVTITNAIDEIITFPLTFPFSHTSLVVHQHDVSRSFKLSEVFHIANDLSGCFRVVNLHSNF